MGIRASQSFRYIAPTTRTAKSSILTPKIAKIPFAETGWLETARKVKILMRLPYGRNVATRQAVHGKRTIDTKLLIYGLFQKGRVLAQDGMPRSRAET